MSRFQELQNITKELTSFLKEVCLRDSEGNKHWVEHEEAAGRRRFYTAPAERPSKHKNLATIEEDTGRFAIDLWPVPSGHITREEIDLMCLYREALRNKGYTEVESADICESVYP